MDRRNALEKLDVVRHDSDDLSDAELADAIAALDQDAAARQEFDRRLQLDAKIATAMQSVEVPADLKNKLLAAVATPTAKPASDSAKIHPGKSRRGLLIAAMACAALFAAAILLRPGRTQVSYNQIVNFAPRDAPATAWPSVEHPFELPNLLARKKTSQQLWPSKAMPLDGNSSATSLVMASSNRQWVLIVTPLEQVTGFDQTGTSSGKTTTGHQYRAWQDADFVYVLFVPPGANLNQIYDSQFRATAA